MTSTKDFAQYVTDDLFADIGEVSSRAMFGGYGLYKDGVIFGIIVDNTVYLKVDETNKSEYEELHSKPFTYTMKNNKKSYSMSYFELPESIMENPELLESWVQKSLAISKASQKLKAKKKP